jgi:hypothetical protein
MKRMRAAPRPAACWVNDIAERLRPWADARLTTRLPVRCVRAQEAHREHACLDPAFEQRRQAAAARASAARAAEAAAATAAAEAAAMGAPAAAAEEPDEAELLRAQNLRVRRGPPLSRSPTTTTRARPHAPAARRALRTWATGSRGGPASDHAWRCAAPGSSVSWA